VTRVQLVVLVAAAVNAAAAVAYLVHVVRNGRRAAEDARL